MLNQFIITNSDSETVRVWGNGSNFDNVILEHTYRLLNIKLAWKNQNDRCFRTLKKIYPEMKIERCGTYHNALDDAITQAKHAIKIYGRINRMNKVAKIGILGLSVVLKDISEYKF